MSLRDVMAYLQKQQTAAAADTPDTPEKIMGYQPKPAWIGACTPDTSDTPRLYEVGCTAPIERPDAAANDHTVGNVATPPAPAPAPAPAPEPTDWRTLDKAYQAHHVNCHVCQAAGRGTRYGLRCGVGAALWTAYDAAVTQPGALPWQQQARPQRD